MMQLKCRKNHLLFLLFVFLIISKSVFASDDDWVTNNGTTYINGPVGIGNSNPEGNLDVEGETVLRTLRIRSNNKDTTTDIQMDANANLATTTSLAIIMDSDNDNANSYIMFGSNSPNRTNLQEYMRIREDGNVGMGTSIPDRNLDIVSTSGNVDMELDTQDESNSFIKFTTNSSGTQNNGYIGVDYSEDTLKLTRDGLDGSAKGIIIDASGKVGIGTTNPEKNLHISRNQNANALLGEAPSVLLLEQANNNDWSYGEAAGEILFKKGGDIISAIRAEHTRSGGPHSFEDAGLTFYVAPKAETPVPFEAMRIDHLGHMGIGTTNTTDHKLNVAGTIRADEIIVDTSGADYVFSLDYDLKPLSEVASYISEHKHLPGVQSAEEMKKNGMGMSEMQTKLLAKVEELTLYLIDLKKQNDRQQEQIQALEAKLATIGQHQ